MARYARRRFARKRPLRSRKAARRRFVKLAVATGVAEEMKAIAILDPDKDATDAKQIGEALYTDLYPLQTAASDDIAGVGVYQKIFSGGLLYTNPSKPPYTPTRVCISTERQYFGLGTWRFPQVRQTGIASSSSIITGQELVVRNLWAKMTVGYRAPKPYTAESTPTSIAQLEYPETTFCRVMLLSVATTHFQNSKDEYKQFSDALYQRFIKEAIGQLPNPVHNQNRPLDRIPMDTEPRHVQRYPRYMDGADALETSSVSVVAEKVFYSKGSFQEDYERFPCSFFKPLNKKYFGQSYIPDELTELSVFMPSQLDRWYCVVAITNMPSSRINTTIGETDVSYVDYGWFIENPKLGITWLP